MIIFRILTDSSFSADPGYFYWMVANIHAFVDTAPQQMFQEKSVLLAHTFAGDLELRVKMIAPGFVRI